MSNIIHPIIFFSIFEKRSDLFNNLSINLGNINTAPFKERYFRHLWIDHNFQIRNSINDLVDHLPLQDFKNKAENLKIINSNRNLLKAVFERQIDSFFKAENYNYAIENNFEIGAPQILIHAEIDNPVIAPLVIPLIQNIDSIRNLVGDYSLNPQVHLFLIYHTKVNENEPTFESKICKYGLFSDLETAKFPIKPYIWLLDNVNEQSIHLDDEQAMNVSICRFIELLFTNATDLTSSTYTDHILTDGKPCLYSTFGYSSLTYPKYKIRDYLLKYVYGKELKQITNEFALTYETITIKDELIRFFQHSVFKDVSKNITLNNQKENIFKPFKFNIEKFISDERDKTIDRPLSLIDTPDTISKVNTSDMLHQISTANKKYSQDVIVEFSQQLEFAKKRELELTKTNFDETVQRLLDSKGCGVNYAILFSAVLADNKSVVESMFDGRFTSDVPNFTNFQESFRSLFIGNQIKEAQNSIKEYSDKVSNNIKLIHQYTFEKGYCEKTIETLASNSDESNPKLVELNTKIENYTTQIYNLSNENEGLNLEIADLAFFIETKRNEFDQDPTKESFKAERTQKIKEEIAEINKKIFPAIDNELSSLYQQKNESIQKRQKFILYQLIVIPILTSFFLTIFSLFAFTFHKDAKLLLNSFGISSVILGIYYIIRLLKFSRLKKAFNELIFSIQQKIEYKKNRFLLYVGLINDCFQKEFEFERDLISFNFVTPLIQKSSQKQSELASFKDYLIRCHEEYQMQLEQFHFESNAFDFCVIEKAAISDIYDSSNRNPLVGSASFNSISLSQVYKNFEESGDMGQLKDIMTKVVDDLYKRKIESETLAGIMFSESKIFSPVLGPAILFKKLLSTSRPLLKTDKINKDVPYCHDITVGFLHEGFFDYLKNSNIDGSIKIDSGNKDLLGLISIKSNIPSHIIYDMRGINVDINERINDENKHRYFVNDKSYVHALGKSSLADNQVADGSAIPDLLIFALTIEDIKFVPSKKQFINEKLGSLGENWNHLLSSWDSPLCHDLKTVLDTKYNNMSSVFEAKDYQEMSKRFIRSMLLINSVTSKELENCLSVFYFSILHGTQAGWNEVQSHFKQVKINSI